MYENRERNSGYKYIGIELTDEYIPISVARIKFAANEIDEPAGAIKNNNMDPDAEEDQRQMTIFDYLGA